MSTPPDTRYERGFADGRREAARLMLDTAADNGVTLAGRLAEFPGAVGAVNEATAILRDAARALAFDPGATRTQAVRPAKERRTRGGGTAQVKRAQEGTDA